MAKEKAKAAKGSKDTKTASKAPDRVAKASVDFSNVSESSGFSPKRLPEGDYTAKITKAVLSKSAAGNDQFVVTLVPESHKSAVYPFYLPLAENSLWKLRNLLVAAGVPVPKAKGQVDLTKAIGKVIGITLEDDEFEDKEKSKVMATFPADEVDEVDTDDEADEPEEKPTKKSKAKAEPEPKAKGKGKGKKKKASDDIDL